MSQEMVSIVIPVYNDEKYLRECLDSVVHQTLPEIEIVCVNDGSTDGTKAILEEYAARDSRFLLLHHERNQGILMARKTGVMGAGGDYIMFLDHDDYLAENCCETALSLIQEKGADMLRFTYETLVFEGERLLQRRDCHPCREERSGVVDRPFSPDANDLCPLWARIYRAALAKKAFQSMDDFFCVYSEDWYASFYLLVYARSVVGVRTCPLLFYCLGRGKNGSVEMPLREFETACAMSGMSGRTRAFLEREGLWDTYSGFWRQFRYSLVEGCLNLMKRLRQEDYEAGVRVLLAAWEGQISLEDLVGEMNKDRLAKQQWAEEMEQAKLWYLSQMEHRDARIQELEAWARELEQSKAWLEQQRQSEERGRVAAETALAEQKAWSQELEQSKAWLEQQRQSEERGRVAAETALAEQKAWTRELEQGKAWLEQQRQSEERDRLAAEQALEEQRLRGANLEAEKANLEAKLNLLKQDAMVRGIIRLRHYEV